MPLIKSFIYSLKEARFNPLTVIHSTLYAATVTYLRILNYIVKTGSESFRSQISETYHSKVLRLDDAAKIITLNRDIELRNLDQLLPYKHANSIILNNPQNIVVYECPCRGQKKDHCKPSDVCLVVGDPFVDLIRMFHPFRARRIAAGEALRILKEEDERGHVHTAWFKHTMLDRFYAICNCCRCCCLGMKFMNEYGMKMLIPSGYRAVSSEACTGCGICTGYCQFEAIEMITSAVGDKQMKKCHVIREKCFGCGVCEDKCKRNAIHLELDPEKGIPMNIEALAQQGGA